MSKLDKQQLSARSQATLDQGWAALVDMFSCQDNAAEITSLLEWGNQIYATKDRQAFMRSARTMFETMSDREIELMTAVFGVAVHEIMTRLGNQKEDLEG